MFDGNIRKRKDGRYEMQITVGTNSAGKRIRKSFYGATKREVTKKRDKWVRETDIYKELDVGKTEEFSKWTDIWLETYKKPTIREYTYEVTYKSRVDKHLKPYFKNRPLNSITQMDIQQFFNEHRDMSLASLKTMRVILSNIFKKALLNGLCDKNPVEDIKLNSTQIKKEKKAFNAVQQRKAIDWSKKQGYYEIAIALKTGIRRGELFGLKWNDIDFDNKIMYISRSISPPINGNVDKKLKNTSSDRILPIDDELISIFKSMPKDGENLFNDVSVNAFAKKATKKLRQMSKECNLPYLTLHELRHSCGTVLREQGVDIYSISKVLGHSSINVTSAIYVHNDVEVLRQALNMKR